MAAQSVSSMMHAPHHLNIAFFQASIAGIAGSGACVALFDAGRIGVGYGQSYLLSLHERRPLSVR